jgi:hypothetical protein
LLLGHAGSKRADDADVSAKQVQKVVETFQQLVNNRSTHTKAGRFDHALRVGKYFTA